MPLVVVSRIKITIESARTRSGSQGRQSRMTGSILVVRWQMPQGLPPTANTTFFALCLRAAVFSVCCLLCASALSAVSHFPLAVYNANWHFFFVRSMTPAGVVRLSTYEWSLMRSEEHAQTLHETEGSVLYYFPSRSDMNSPRHVDFILVHGRDWPPSMDNGGGKRAWGLIGPVGIRRHSRTLGRFT